jgi:hypothetical protein
LNDTVALPGYVLGITKSNSITEYNGNPQQLITAVTLQRIKSDGSISTPDFDDTDGTANVNLYLRVTDNLEASVTSANWKRVKSNSDLSDTLLKGTNAGKYYIFYCVANAAGIQEDTDYPDSGMNA